MVPRDEKSRGDQNPSSSTTQPCHWVIGETNQECNCFVSVRYLGRGIQDSLWGGDDQLGSTNVSITISKMNQHWLIRGGGTDARDVCVCLPDPNTFIFMQFLATFCEIIGQRTRSGVGAPCEIQEPPPEGATDPLMGRTISWCYKLGSEKLGLV